MQSPDSNNAPNNAGSTDGRGGLSVRAVVAMALAAWTLLGLVPPGRVSVVAATLVGGTLLFGTGYLFLRLLSRGPVPLATIAMLALPAGVIVGGSLAQALHHSFGQLRVLAWLIAVPALPGLMLAVRETWGLGRERLRFGWLYLIAVVAVGVFFYFPEARLESVQLADGSIRWTYPDPPFQEAITAVVAEEPPPLRNPGYVQVKLPYHYARNALAAVLFLVTGNSVGDCLWRSVHCLGVASLLLAAIALGWATARNGRQRPLSGVLAVAIVFCLPPFPAVTMNDGDSCSRRPQVIIPGNEDSASLPEKLAAKVTAETAQGLADGATEHYLGGGSLLWAGIVVLTVATLLSGMGDAAGLSLQERKQMSPFAPRKDATLAEQMATMPYAALLLAVAGLTLNGVAGIICAGVVSGFVLIGNPSLRGLAFAACGAILFFLFRHATGLDQPVVDGTWAGFKGVWFELIRASLRGFFLLASFQILCIAVFLWGTRASKIVLALFVPISLGLFLLLVLQGYPLGILRIVLAGYAAAPMAAILHSLAGKRAHWKEVWAGLAGVFQKYLLGMMVLAAVLLPPAWYPYFHHRAVESIYGFSILLPTILAICTGLFFLLRRLEKTGFLPSRAGSLIVLVVLGACSLAGWARSEVNFAFDLLGNSIELDAGRVKSLEFVRKNLPSGSLFATTHHNVEARTQPERSYAYSALTHRYALIEGWRYRCDFTSPSFEQTRRDNDLLFVTDDAIEARRIIQKYGITHLIVEPNQSLGFGVSRVEWLRRLENPGTLTIFQVK